MKQKKGFTLIELLVVVMIIMILASVVIVSLNTARRGSRDTKRVADVTMVASALQLYFADKHVYPNPSSWDDLMNNSTTGLVTLRYLDSYISQYSPDSNYACNRYYYIHYGPPTYAESYKLYFTPEDISKATCTAASGCAAPAGCPANGQYLIKSGQTSATWNW